MSDAARIKELEGQVQRLEQERDQWEKKWEKKYEETQEKWRKSQSELADLEASMQDL